ncbi:MAG TPA: helix-turn-helix domain-containing protein, partial [Hyphomicrobiaceae bacterium]|nr:helix-turn-helix domain-containing protein [Hyphomicrobiaceae bacterium]
MQKFRDVLGRWERRELSQPEAAELLGCSERQFRRYRDRFEAEGDAGLLDKRLGRASPTAIGESEAERLRALYRSMYGGWTAKHFHEHGVRH